MPSRERSAARSTRLELAATGGNLQHHAGHVRLGIYPFAPAHLVALVRPSLPAWLNTVIVRRLRVGTGRVSIRFERAADGTTTYETFDRSGSLHVIEVPPPQANDRHGWRDWLAKWILEHAPGRTAAALRIAIGDEE